MVVTAEIWNRFVQVQGEESFERGAGSGTILEIDGERLLVTADHLTNGEPEEYLQIRAPFITGDSLINDVFVRRTPRIAGLDVAAFLFPIEHESLDQASLPFGSDGLAFSQDVYVLGHPYGLQLQLGEDHPALQLPLVKRGIVAGRTWMNGTQLLFVDVIANPGFSGGPAVLQMPNTRNWSMIGVVKGQFTQKGPLNALGDEADEPAGITAITEIQDALRRLNE